MTIHRSRSVRRVAVPAVAGVMALALAACGSSSSSSSSKNTGNSSNASGAPTNGVLTAGLLGDIGMPPDPATFYAGNGIAIMKNVYEGLVMYKNDTDQVGIAPQLATSWTSNADKTVWTFKLRSGVTFHDGTAFTSAAVGPSIKRMADIKGGPSYLAAVVKSVATPDDLTAVITLKEANSAFLNYLASAFGPKMLSPTGMVKYAGTDQDQTYLKTHDLGTGAYELTTAEVGRKYGLTQYAGYWGTKSPFKQINLPVYTQDSALELAFDKGDVDMIVNALPSSALSRYESKSDVNNYFLPMLATAQVTTNPNKTFFKTKEARIAYLKTINSAQFVKEVLNPKLSTVATTMYARGMITNGTDKQTITYDTSAMKAYAKTLSAADNSMTVGFQTNQPNGQKMANIEAALLQTLGIHAKAQGYTTAQVFSWGQDPTKGPDTFIDPSNGPDGGDPYMWGHVFWDKSGGIDFLQCDVPSVDDELNTAVKTGDAALYVKASQDYSANGCYLHIANNNDWILAKKWITGIAASHNLGAFETDFSLLGIAK
jgi:peptide/nickel transport system substrate-binding protein